MGGGCAKCRVVVKGGGEVHLFGSRLWTRVMGLMLWLMLILSCGIAFENLVQVPKTKNHERWKNLLILIQEKT